VIKNSPKQQTDNRHANLKIEAWEIEKKKTFTMLLSKKSNIGGITVPGFKL
jgi:hypothetical protein